MVGVVGLVANLVAAWALSGHRDSLNVEGAYLHLLADAAGSVAAIALGLALLVTDWYVLDPVFALVVAALVCYSVWGLLRDSLNVLLQGTPSGVDLDEILQRTQRLFGRQFGIDHATLQLEGAHVETAAFDCHQSTDADRPPR